MDLSFRHDFWRHNLPRSPRDLGQLERIVIRPIGSAAGERRAVDRAQLDEHGLVDDKWRHDDAAFDGGQVSLVNVHVIRSCAGGDDGKTLLSGDNLQVDLELSEENLPVGTELAIGEALLVVSETPHRPCKKFHERFGKTAAQRVARANRVGARGRGVLCRVRVPGTVRAGDAIEVTRPE